MMKKFIPFYQVDAFTNKLFKGNPAAVCILKQWPDDQILQSIAMENNLAETAFIIGEGDLYDLRWFTPTMEIELCGHATLASAYVLMEVLKIPFKKVIFQTLSGILEVCKTNNYYTLDFPGRIVEPCVPPSALLLNFERPPREVLKSGTGTYIVVLENQGEVANFCADFDKLAMVDRCVNITASGDNCDFVSRFFGPNIGINEDPVTGSAHCGLAIFWSKRLNKKTNLHAIQLSERTGEIFCSVKKDRVLLTGQACLYLRGAIFLE